MAEGHSGNIIFSPACSLEPEQPGEPEGAEEPEIQQILEDIATAAVESGIKEEDSEEDEDDTAVGAHRGYPHTPNVLSTDLSPTLDSISAAMQYVMGAVDTMMLRMDSHAPVFPCPGWMDSHAGVRPAPVLPCPGRMDGQPRRGPACSSSPVPREDGQPRQGPACSSSPVPREDGQPCRGPACSSSPLPREDGQPHWGPSTSPACSSLRGPRETGHGC